MKRPPRATDSTGVTAAQDIQRRQVALARSAADGDPSARRTINDLVHPIISYQSHRFCRRFCSGNRYRYVCTLEPPLPLRAPADALLCEFGNASYAWMLEDLTRPERLQRFEGRGGARITDYLFHIANSLPFYERWKDWRFGRRGYVPTYIRELDPMAARVFLELRAKRDPGEIAQTLHLGEAAAEALCHAIVARLTRRHRLHLLDPPRTISLSEPENDPAQMKGSAGWERELPSFDEAPEERDAKQRLQAAWQHLTQLEQLVLEAMLIDGDDADTVLQALKVLELPIKRGVAPNATNRQQLYYFRRKAFEKLRRLMATEAPR